jgi:DNA-binding NtrC family response regulator
MSMTARSTLTIATSEVDPSLVKSSSSKPSKLKVLLVEDDTVALEELCEISEFEDWEPIKAQTVDEALATLETDKDIRVVVTDVHFVDASGQAANGIQLVSRARAKFADRTISYIVLSGDPCAMASSDQEGAFEFLIKPLVPDQLIETVNAAISGGDSIYGGPFAAGNGS